MLDTKSRSIFPTKLARRVQSEFTAFSRTDMSRYTIERKKSDFYHAKADLSVFDGDGKLQLLGRDFGDQVFFWQP